MARCAPDDMGRDVHADGPTHKKGKRGDTAHRTRRYPFVPGMYFLLLLAGGHAMEAHA